MSNKLKKQKKLKKKNPVAKLLSSPMLRNKIVKNKKNRHKFIKVISNHFFGGSY